ncbi:MAG: hypothetical protein A3I44_00780 [Candidatus Sungbacteria bacterium RIFCSPLOWO2_02_FULL_51_17]|nr:MAG: hypothetical protein A2676_01825 [Candidatus Sungbacteria bacterium RIFCSPHIGHO2_01_FULL_51_22]OHA07607.1 MAG: hypothetical protein A3B29_03945 [Candidatus Sungbacteria bacterium RIFCSPLOWO2_01_FULL_51_34]OHA10657.1 MAG: hypothetical protein A3I44_00780 [Candidatus Sungbacteria bacterium RIFCSPLOWO2_02_FULL_51_17]
MLLDNLFLFFWGFIFLLIALSIGQGPFYMDVARVALVLMVAVLVIFVRKPNLLPKNYFKTIETGLWLVLVGAGILAHNIFIVIVAGAIAALVGVGYIDFVLWLRKK